MQKTKGERLATNGFHPWFKCFFFRSKGNSKKKHTHGEPKRKINALNWAPERKQHWIRNKKKTMWNAKEIMADERYEQNQCACRTIEMIAWNAIDGLLIKHWNLLCFCFICPRLWLPYSSHPSNHPRSFCSSRPCGVAFQPNQISNGVQ